MDFDPIGERPILVGQGGLIVRHELRDHGIGCGWEAQAAQQQELTQGFDGKELQSCAQQSHSPGQRQDLPRLNLEF